MIEIIKKGNKNKVHCAFCGCVMIYQKEDIQEKECYRSQRDSYILKYITCPQCHQLITLEDNK